MKSLKLPLCAYCEARPCRPGEIYCCDGCRTLAHFSKTPRPVTLEPAKEDPAFLNFVGKPFGPLTRFECYVDPLACEACLQGLVRLEELIPGLRDLQWNRRQSVLSFQFAKGHEHPSKVFAFLKDLHLSPNWKLGDDQRSLQNERNRNLRLGLTAALAGNIMLFAVPIYAGLAGSLERVFEVIQGALFLPIFLWSARPFYRSAWLSLRLRQLSLELPLTLAFLAGSVFSFISLFDESHQIYFDSLAGFLVLILWSRSLLENSLARYLEAPALERFFEKPLFEIQRNGESKKVSLQEIKPGDILHLTEGERIPVDGFLVSSSAKIETAWMSGETIPHWRLRGSAIQAGTRLLSKFSEIQVSKEAKSTQFAQLLSRLQPGASKIQSSVEARLGTALVMACLVAIMGLLVFGNTLTTAEIFRRAISLLIVACPCAVTFAAPMARAKANRLAFRKGFWIQDPLVWNRLTKIKKIAFDKTGTLTGGVFAMSPNSPMVDSYWKQIILSLENISVHPVAESLRRAWGPIPLRDVTEQEEIFGSGVRGKIDGSAYELRGSSSSDGSLHVELLRDGVKVISLSLRDEAANQVHEVLMKFSKNYELFLISGDHKQRVMDFGLSHGFLRKNIFGALSPIQKLEKIEELSPDLFLGDGTNDLLALKKTPVSIAVRLASPEAQAAADILMLDHDLGKCADLFQIARETEKLNRRNFAIALLYNGAAGIAALSGLIFPLAAALLMPVASFALLASTLVGTKKLRALEGES